MNRAATSTSLWIVTILLSTLFIFLPGCTAADPLEGDLHIKGDVSIRGNLSADNFAGTVNATTVNATYIDASTISAVTIIGSATPAAHASTHEHGGGDEIDIDNIGGSDAIISLLKRGKPYPILTYGWSTASTGSASTAQLPFRLLASAGATPNSETRAYTYPTNLAVSGTNYVRADLEKDMILMLCFARSTDDTQGVGYAHFKGDTAHGDADVGSIGVKVVNYTLYGESFGTSQALVSLGNMIGYTTSARVLIVHQPSIPRIDWYVDFDGGGWVLKGSQTTSANIPQAKWDGQYFMVFSWSNGAAGNASYLAMMSPYIWIDAN